MSIDPVGTSGAASGPAAVGNGQERELGKDDFLRLMVIQLTQQDPMNPQDSTQYVAQLAQFSSLERMLNVEKGVNNVALAATATNSTLSVDFIGKRIRTTGDGVQLDSSGEARLSFTLPSDASEVTIEIRDSDGELVRTISDSGQKGDNTVTWDGLSDDDLPLPKGDYTFKVSAKDAQGNQIIATTESIRTVQSVSFKNGYPELILSDGESVSLAEVSEVLGPKTETQDEE